MIRVKEKYTGLCRIAACQALSSTCKMGIKQLCPVSFALPQNGYYTQHNTVKGMWLDNGLDYPYQSMVAHIIAFLALCEAEY